MAEIQFQNVSARVDNKTLLKNVSATLSSGEFIALIGPNGAGKTSLLRCALGLLPYTDGDVLIGGTSVSDLPPLERAKQITYLPQIRPLVWPVRVKDVVALGRYAYGASPGKLSSVDAEAVTTAMADCDINDHAERRTDRLSGGELARVHCARAFAGKTPLLLADEPVSALDPSHQLRIMSLFRQYVDDGGCAVVVIHDLSLVARYADRIIWMKDGAIVDDGSVAATMTEKRIEEVFNVKAVIDLDKDVPNVTITGQA